MTLLDQLASLFRKADNSRVKAGLPRAERHATQGFSCFLGQIVDMSKSGMKVRCEGKPELTPGRFVEISVSSPFQRITLKTRVVWVRKCAGDWCMGFQFQDVGPALGEALDSLAKFGFAPLQQPGSRRGRSAEDERDQQEKEYAQQQAAKHAGGEASGGPVTIEASVTYTDLYAILGVEAEADERAIKTAYRQQALKLHPDINKTPEAAEQFGLVCKAYAILCDKAKRAKYDGLRTQGRKAA